MDVSSEGIPSSSLYKLISHPEYIVLRIDVINERCFILSSWYPRCLVWNVQCREIWFEFFCFHVYYLQTMSVNWLERVPFLERYTTYQACDVGTGLYSFFFSFQFCFFFKRSPLISYNEWLFTRVQATPEIIATISFFSLKRILRKERHMCSKRSWDTLYTYSNTTYARKVCDS
jgi:hypothetical protein